MACGKTVPGTVHIPELISKNFTGTSPRIIVSSANFTTAGPLFDITDNQGEHKELTAIYVERGLDPALAKRVADQLMAHDAIGAHARDELGISENFTARPIQAALASVGSFAVGAAMPLLTAALVPETSLIPVVSGTSLVSRAFGRVGGARGRCTRDGGRNARHVVGCIGHGTDRRGRSSLWNRVSGMEC